MWLLTSVPEDVVPDDSEDPLLLVLPDVVEPSEKGLWKGLLGTGLWLKGPWKQLPPEVMVLEGAGLPPGLLWMNSTGGLLQTLWAGLLVGAGCSVGVGSGLRWTGAGLLLTEVGSSSGSSSMSSQSGRQYADGGPSGWASAGAWGSSGCGSPGSWGTPGAAVAGCPRGGKGEKVSPMP